ncbi:aminoacyl-tRNA hydrolase [Candidatus Falkowbacteria bacterium CG10_big_fil_rev_8_21_14_0_10_39_9]|uniref:Peptidyl-tRNA hydrolase n=1 Tax=Candidatus Falkowbacteria bacterium CG10_big_fil_rev_8_21_14_0_10_39_9 TaxID=1974566 RepID=A0A2M6WQE2_9BACT|nr:MAG: aminoacyl-tRNA hydrolase [Candidatus Falkowbacteria bacterium CG10_big_fil_rev_8_21_14_0_10_39_9]
MKIIVGLGNPGEEYSKTRHNVGWLVLDAILGKVRWSLNKKWNALVYEQGGDIYVKPQTFMNNSGMATTAALNYYHLLPKTMGLFSQKDSDLSQALTVIHDDLDVDLGKIKVAVGSRSAGHNGVQSIINHTKTLNFKRIRVGIRTADRERIPADKFVLGRLKAEELKEIERLIEDIRKEI